MKFKVAHNPKKSILIVALLIAMSGFAGWMNTRDNTSYAADIRNFDPGNIMSDAVMSNKNTMSVQDIQNFLNSKNYCDNKNIHLAAQYPNLKYNIKDGKFVCMARESFDGQSAAQIIWQVAQDYSINPQFLLVLLEKEQGLISDTWPNSRQYQTATGFGCPDTAACDTKYFGLKNQLQHAASLFRTVLNGGWSNYPVGQTYVQYNPNAQCGGSVINIQNRATSALYRYTPYQPNKSALEAGYGTGDSCGAYGNRNTWRLFTDWFGSTTVKLPGYKFEQIVGVDSSVINKNNFEAGDYSDTLMVNGSSIYTAYSDKTASQINVLYWDGRAWTEIVLDGPGSTVNGSTNSNVDIGQIKIFSFKQGVQVFYRDNASNALRHAWKDRVDSPWRIETLDGTTSNMLKNNNPATSLLAGFSFSTNDIQLFYDTSSGELVHTWWNGRTWSTEILDGNPNSVLKNSRRLGQAISGFAYMDNGIQLYYHDTSSGELVHTWWNGRTWSTEILDGSLPPKSIIGNYINSGKSISTSSAGRNIYVYYFDDPSGFVNPNRTSAWRAALWNGESWTGYTLDGGSEPLSNLKSDAYGRSLTVTSYGKYSQIFYRDNTGGLRHAWF